MGAFDEDDRTSDGLPRFIYGEQTEETQLPDRPDEPEQDTTRKTIVLVAAGGVALLLMIGLVVAALASGDGTPQQTAARPSNGPVAPVASQNGAPNCL